MKYKLGELCDVVSGGTPSRAITEFWEGGTIPWIKIGNIKGKYVGEADEYITQAGLEGSSAKILSAGTILFTIFATLGEVGILTIKACTNQAIAGITIKNQSEALTDYLYYFLKSKKPHVTALGRGVAQNNINLSILRNFEVPIPALSMQKQIVDVLDKAEKIIEAHQQQLQKLDELVKARFVEIFGAYPLNPMGWKKGTIRDVVADVRYGSSRPAVDGGKYPYLRMNNITYGGELDLSDVKRIDVPENELGKCTVRRGDVLFNRTNSKELVGKTCVYDRDEMMVLAGFVIRVRVNDLVLPEFLSAFLNADFSKMTLLGMCKAAIGQANINAQEMQNIGIYIPPIELQREFVQFKNQTDKSKVAVQKALDETQLLFDSLMQKYFG